MINSSQTAMTDPKKTMGARLKDYREARGLTMYRVAKDGGIPIKLVKAVELGDTSYTIDTLLGYLKGCRMHLYFLPELLDAPGYTCPEPYLERDPQIWPTNKGLKANLDLLFKDLPIKG